MRDGDIRVNLWGQRSEKIRVGIWDASKELVECNQMAGVGNQVTGN